VSLVNKEIEPMQSNTDRVFRISEAVIRRRHINTALGIVFGIALCIIAVGSNAVDSDKYNDTLMASVVLVVAVFGLFNLVGHLRYFLNSRKHHLEVGEDRITFVTGSDQSVLELSEVASAEQQSRLYEGPSLMMRLKNKRIVRLVGYECQEALADLVIQRIAWVQTSAPACE
jgi:hypothetical protein